ncbi:glycosyltransferase family 2 protein [Patescibacteria group bacterium]|nr:glycosyltransferase family 2 protein [Patescibacteria group bacterium]MBU1448564.1 glycosyltransferase family 2 protein [Patescibacteria group bacterium]MBU2613198.1 glycosyltransferase family 2 protein [Patescibacteria group bacterium]
MPKLSVIVPVYFNEANLPTTIPELQQTLAGIPDMDGELVFVDDGSGDASYALLKDAAATDPRIKVVRLSRNFGAHTALLAGVDHATGDCLAIIMADLQDPPELLRTMVEEWRRGSKLVIAARETREDRWIDRVFAGFFWWFIRRFALKDMPRGGFDYVLFDRAIADIVSRTRERNSHLMTFLLWTGFTPKIIPYVRRQRRAGTSRWTFSKKLKLFIDSAIAFSFVPVRAMSAVGLVTAVVGFVAAVVVVVDRILRGTPVQGWTSLMVVVLLVGGLQMLMMGVIGEYLWRTYDESRKRPSYVVSDTLNL